MLRRLVRAIGGDPNKRAIEGYAETIQEINALELRLEALSDEALRTKTLDFRRRLAHGETLDDISFEAFAVVREASKRTIGLRHYDIQLIGGMVLHQGTIAEMRTGEGKTLVATLPLYLNALTLNPGWVAMAVQQWGDNPELWSFAPIQQVPVGKGTHLITVNDYLARRDARWMAPIFDRLGLTVGVLQMAARTESGKRAFVVDLERSSPHEDQHQLRMVPRKEAYQADVTYGTNSEFGFDYLRDNMAMRLEDRVQRGHHYAIIDEVDNVLIDEARTPLIISGPAHDDTEWYTRMAQVVKQLRNEDFEVNEKDRTVTLTEIGETRVEQLLDMPLRDPERPEDITPQQARILGYLEQALRAQHLFHRNKEYLVQAGKVVIVDEFTGRMMPGRRWSDGLHQAVEAKEGVRVQRENVTYATITIQNYFRMYEKLSGMTGTAVTEAEEFHKIYDLEVLAIPTNLEFQASRPESDLKSLESRDEDGYRFTFYTTVEDVDQTPLFWKRKDYPDVVYRTEEAKLRAITREVMQYHIIGRPMLVGTTSVELSEVLSQRLRAESVRKFAQIMLLRYVWFQVHGLIEDGRQVQELEFLKQPLQDLRTPELRRLARELDISLNPEAESNLDHLLDDLGLEKAHKNRLLGVLQGGIPHQVLNARKHTEESQIIAGAGAFGAVTIATNMAGRGVDIRLGGEIPEETIRQVRLLLRRKDIAQRMDEYGLPQVDELQIGQWPEALTLVDPTELRSRSEAVDKFNKYVQAEENVRRLGGLHVIGSERHEARRIDNQLRGRSARQGDPGSSRFYLSMEDNLMRLFGGQQANDMMDRLRIDDAVPIEFGMVSRIIEQSQTRVEGANFDVRKHLLEYDDVLNTQREKIYGQRDRIFVKEDLSEDVTEMLTTEVLDRVPGALADEDGPWRLLAWLEQIQPTLVLGNQVYPSYLSKILVDNLMPTGGASRDAIYAALVDLVRGAIDAEEDHLLLAANRQLVLAQDRFESQLEERLELIDTFFEGLSLADETDTRGPRELVAELSNLVRTPIRLSSTEQRSLREDPEEVIEIVREQVEASLSRQTSTRLVGAMERLLGESLAQNPGDLDVQDWDQVADELTDGIKEVFNRRRVRYLGENGEGVIAKELKSTLSSIPEPINPVHLFNLLLQIPQGAKATFDRKTHRRVWQRTTRLTYVYHAAHRLQNRDPEEVANEVLEHLQGAKTALQRAWGSLEVSRLAAVSPADLDAMAQRGLKTSLGDAVYDELANQSFGQVDGSVRIQVVEELGRQALTEVYRQLLLGVISELWVDYLTQMEALRVSIGLEAYAQRDPLVEYKNRAFAMFQQLLRDMRVGVVTRMFTFRPRDLTAVQQEVKQGEAPDMGAPVPEAEATTAEGASGKRGRRRRRRKQKK